MSKVISILEAAKQIGEACKDYISKTIVKSTNSGIYLNDTNITNRDIGNYSLAEGQYTQASGSTSHAEGKYTQASGTTSHAEGYSTQAKGNEGSHAEGYYTEANGYRGSHAEGYYTKATGSYGSHAEGRLTVTEGDGAHAEGSHTTAKGNYSHAEGGANSKYNQDDKDNSKLSIIDYYMTLDSESKFSLAYGMYSHVEGACCLGIGERSHAEGFKTIAKGINSHAQGTGTFAEQRGQSVSGRFNIIDTSNKYINIVGIGQDENNRANALGVTWDGYLDLNKSVRTAGADYAEFFEWEDGNPGKEDRVGYVVAINGNKIHKAKEDDKVLGIISATTSIIGDSHSFVWKNKYITDEFGRIQYDVVEEFEETINPETQEIEQHSVGFASYPRVNPEWNKDKEYLPRDQRPEWAAVGLMGKIFTRDDGTCQIGSYAKVGNNGILTHSEEETTMYVMERSSDNVVLIMLK